MLFTIQEIIDLVIMTFIIGYIFKDIFPDEESPLVLSADYLERNEYKRFKFAILAVASAIILHELGHKFVALAFGIDATFHAAYSFLLFGLLLKILNFPVFFVPAYVSHAPTSIPISVVIAFAGPMAHAILWFFARYSLNNRLVPRKYRLLVSFIQYINGFLFVLNMLPIPGFDGFYVFYGLFRLFL